jgi:hypothetical protein
VSSPVKIAPLASPYPAEVVKCAVVAVFVTLEIAGTASAGPVPPRCVTDVLHMSVTHTEAALSTVGGYLAFTNEARSACTLRGWPTLTALRPGASTTAIHVRETMFGPYTYVHGVPRYVRGVPTVLLRHGQTAVAAFTAGDHGPGATDACPPPYQHLRVTPPGNTTSTLLPAWIAWYDHNLPDCTRIEVSMVVSASGMPPR